MGRPARGGGRGREAPRKLEDHQDSDRHGEMLTAWRGDAPKGGNISVVQ